MLNIASRFSLYSSFGMNWTAGHFFANNFNSVERIENLRSNGELRVKHKEVSFKMSLICRLYNIIISLAQSMVFSPIFAKYSLVLLKCLHPKNPLYAEKGDGCATVNTKCFDPIYYATFFLRIFAPEDKDHVFAFFRNRFDDGVRKRFPAFVLV